MGLRLNYRVEVAIMNPQTGVQKRPKGDTIMHEYYAENKGKFKKEMDGFLRLISRELEEDTNRPYSELLEEVWECYEQDMLEHFPYIGGSKSSGTRNLTGAYCFVALGEVCRGKYDMSLDRWGYLTTECYRRYFDRIPQPLRLLAGKLLGRPGLVNSMLRKKDARNAANAAEYPGSFVTQVQPPRPGYPVIYHMTVCPLHQFARGFGYMDYMPYLCNLDYVMFEAMNVPFYREKTCAAGDGVCDFKMKPGAPVNPAWPCHCLTPGDPLK